MNQYLAIGNLTKDPEYIEMDEQKYCNFIVAINNRNDDSTFVEVVSYGRQAKACRKHLVKGSQVCVRGLPLVRAYIDKEGVARASLKIRSREIDFISKLKAKSESDFDTMSDIDAKIG